jgi:hypothetical protein
MSMMGDFLARLRLWLGLGDASDAHPTPSHGWLLPQPIDARRQRAELEAGRLRKGERHSPM